MFLEDEDAVAKRAGGLFNDGLAKQNEARHMVGLDPVTDGDTFKAAPAPVMPPGVPAPDPEPDPDPDPDPEPEPTSRWAGVKWGDGEGTNEPNGGPR